MTGNKVGLDRKCKCLEEGNGKLERFRQYFLNNKATLEFQKNFTSDILFPVRIGGFVLFCHSSTSQNSSLKPCPAKSSRQIADLKICVLSQQSEALQEHTHLPTHIQPQDHGRSVYQWNLTRNFF